MRFAFIKGNNKGKLYSRTFWTPMFSGKYEGKRLRKGWVERKDYFFSFQNKMNWFSQNFIKYLQGFLRQRSELQNYSAESFWQGLSQCASFPFKVLSRKRLFFSPFSNCESPTNKEGFSFILEITKSIKRGDFSLFLLFTVWEERKKSFSMRFLVHMKRRGKKINSRGPFPFCEVGESQKSPQEI